jgi:hypothetical protein
VLGPRTDTYAVTQVIAADTVRIVTAPALEDRFKH